MISPATPAPDDDFFTLVILENGQLTPPWATSLTFSTPLAFSFSDQNGGALQVPLIANEGGFFLGNFQQFQVGAQGFRNSDLLLSTPYGLFMH